MKHFIYTFLFIFSLCIGSAPITYAQENISEEMENSSGVSNIEFLQPVFEDKIYSRGDVIEVTLPVINKDSFDYAGMALTSSLVVYTKEGGSIQYGYQNSVPDLFIPKNNTKEISFKFVYPEGVSSTIEDTVRLELSLKNKAGETFGNVGNFIKITHVQNPVEIIDAFLATSKYEYTLQEGPILNLDEVAQVNAVFKNNSKEEIELYPVLKVYDTQITRNLIETKTYEPLTLGVTSDFILFKLDLPTISKAGVYQGELSFNTRDGVSQSSVLYVRWIVDGDFATISDVSVNATTFKKGEVATVDVTYTGPPVNIDTGEARDVGMGMIRVDLYNEKDKLVGTQEKEVNFSIIKEIVQFQIPVTQKAKGIKATVSASKNGVELATYTINLANPDEVQEENKFLSLLGLIAILIVLILITSFMYKKKLHKKLVVMGLFTLVFLGGVGVGEAARDCVATNDFCATVNTNGTTYTPSADMNWSFSVQAETYAGQNAGGNTYVEWHIRQNAVDVRSGNLRYTYGGNTTSGASVWRTIAAFYPANQDQPAKSVVAPPNLGTYNLIVKVWNTTKYKDGGGDGNDYTRGPVTFSFPITVACPAGQNWDGANCVWPPVEPPAAPTQNPTGYHDWSSCSVSAGWACDPSNYNQALDIHFYADGPAGGGGTFIGSTLANTYRQDLVNANVCGGTGSHGFSYSIPSSLKTGTNRSIYAYAINIGTGNNNPLLGGSPNWISCPAPVTASPSGLSASCSADGRTATFSWTNPAGYNRIKFRTYDHNANVNHAWNEDVWGSSYTLNSLTPGNNYSWWIHTRDAVGTEGPAISGNFTCPPQKPVSISASCPTDSTTATISWQNAPGYDSVYFRAYDHSAYPDWDETKIIREENYKGTSKTISVIPGHWYSSWIHTRAPGNGTASEGINSGWFLCPLPPPPTEANAVCSTDTASQAYFTWKNPTGYNSANIRMIDQTATGVTTPQPHAQLKYLNGAVGTSATLPTIPGHKYLWWMHTAGKNSESTLVQGTFTCGNSGAAVCGSTPNTCGTSGTPSGYDESWNEMWWYCPSPGAGGSGKWCVLPKTGGSNSELSCTMSDTSPTINTNVTYTATLKTPDAAAKYEWYIGKSATGNFASTDNPYTTKYTTLNASNDSYFRTVKVTKSDNSTLTTTCPYANVGCGIPPGENTGCINGLQISYICTDTGWKKETKTCTEDNTKIPTGPFKFDPKIVKDANAFCPLFLDIKDTTSCTLNNKFDPRTVIPAATNQTIIENGTRTLPVGTYTLECVGSGSPIPAPTTMGTLSCYTSASVIED